MKRSVVMRSSEKPWERCVLITTKSAISGARQSLIAEVTGLANSSRRLALPKRANRANLRVQSPVIWRMSARECTRTQVQESANALGPAFGYAGGALSKGAVAEVVGI